MLAAFLTVVLYIANGDASGFPVNSVLYPYLIVLFFHRCGNIFYLMVKYDI
jgi:hypothetical protein